MTVLCLFAFSVRYSFERLRGLPQAVVTSSPAVTHVAIRRGMNVRGRVSFDDGI
jgi:hypothetical protein